MKRMLRQAAALPPARFGPAVRGGLFVLLLTGLLLPAGCKNRDLEESRQETKEAKAEIAKLRVNLAKAADEYSKLSAELKAVRQTRDELQERVDQFGQEREHASVLARQAKDMITQLSARADGHAGTATTLEKQVADLRTQLKERDAIIEALQKGATTAQPAANEMPVENALTEDTATTDVNEIP